MGRIQEPEPVKLIVAMLSNRLDLFPEAMQKLSRVYGPVDFSSAPIPFTFTSYYDEEMGSGLMRQFCSLQRLIDPSLLSDVKIFSTEIERESARDVEGELKRGINIDPGYIALSKLVLASTKERSHRIYIGKGIYAEVTLQYEKKRFNPWHWTYPDFRSEEYLRICSHIREIYVQQLRCVQAPESSL